MDYSALEKEVDFDSDPMEECLRIFNESTCVKTEDRGRKARQVRVGAGLRKAAGTLSSESPCDWSLSAEVEMEIQEPTWLLAVPLIPV